MNVRLVLFQSVVMFFRILEILILVRVLMSWFAPRSYSRESQWFFRFQEVVWRLTEPILAPIRNLLPMGGMGMDFSPLIAILLISLVRRLLYQFLILGSF